MPHVTLRVLDGADRGQVYDEMETPITIGREEGNAVQLNDDRVSRYHVKIQEDHDRLVLTDLESTNGTKVNGEDIQLKILRYGDLISVGRSVMLFGSRSQIAGRLKEIRGGSEELSRTIDPDQNEQRSNYDFELNWQDEADSESPIHKLDPPELPDRLSPGQAAQLVEVLEYLHLRIRNLSNAVSVQKDSSMVQFDLERWQSVLDLQARLAEYLRSVGDPSSRGIAT
jgi:hypothetical protein